MRGGIALGRLGGGAGATTVATELRHVSALESPRGQRAESGRESKTRPRAPRFSVLTATHEGDARQWCVPRRLRAEQAKLFKAMERAKMKRRERKAGKGRGRNGLFEQGESKRARRKCSQVGETRRHMAAGSYRARSRYGAPSRQNSGAGWCAEQAKFWNEAKSSRLLFAALDPDPVVPTSSVKVFGTRHACPRWEAWRMIAGSVLRNGLRPEVPHDWLRDRTGAMRLLF